MGQLSTPDRSLGTGQTWQNVLASRASGTVYTNTTGRAISVSVASNSYTNSSATLTAVVAGVTVQIGYTWSSSGGRAWLNFIVPAGATYSVTAATTAIGLWTELR